MRRSSKNHSALRERRGTITVLSAFMSIVVLGMVAFCVDIGYVLSAKEEMQRTADAAALAAAWEYAQQLTDPLNTPTDAACSARAEAQACVNANHVAGKAIAVDANAGNLPDGDITFGYINDVTVGGGTFSTADPNLYNAVRVRVSRNDQANGRVPFYFARVFGLTGQNLEAEATAAIARNMRGYRTPADGSNIKLLPYALDLETWNAMMAGAGPDNYRWTGTTIESDSDSFREMNLFPQATGSPGNRGTVDIGSSNNSTSDIARQILYGVTAEDLAHHGGKLEFDACGELELNGDTGISAGVKDELAEIKGQPRVIPIFSKVEGPGNNAQYTIVKFVGIRIMAVKLTGSQQSKHLTIQAAPIDVRGGIPSTNTGTSEYVYSPAILYQ
ncbi:MAG: pilus assembly protein TadG-related protein [Pirellulales bacterium]